MSFDCPRIDIVASNSELEIIIARCDKLQKSHKIIRFFQAKSIATQIADVKQSIRDTLQVFQVRITTRSSVLKTDCSVCSDLLHHFNRE